jgi:hypothetical protein
MPQRRRQAPAGTIPSQGQPGRPQGVPDVVGRTALACYATGSRAAVLRGSKGEGAYFPYHDLLLGIRHSCTEGQPQ